LAKELEISSKELIEKLNDLSIEVNSHMSTLEDENANIIIELFTNESKKEIISNTKEEPPNQKKHEDIKVEDQKNKPDVPIPTRNKKEKKNKNKNKNKRNKNSMPDNYDMRVESKGERVIQLKSNVTVKELAEVMDKNVSEIITKLIRLGVMATINQEIDYNTAEIIASEFGVEVELLEDTNNDDIIDDVIDEVFVDLLSSF